MAVVVNLLRFYTRNLMLTLLLSSMMLRESSMATESSSNTSATTSAGSNNTLTSAEATTTAPTTTLTPTTPIPTCRNTPTIDNGQVTVNGTTVNSFATYSCNSGYKLNGNNVTLCQQNGKWQELNPTCTLIDCGRPDGNIMNGNITFESTTVNSIATYSCNEGYQQNGAQTITCQADGSWSDKETQCDLRVHSYNETCVEAVTDQQCSTQNATCLLVIDGHRCRCSQDNYYYDEKNDSCYQHLGYNQTCEIDGPVTQCQTNNALCLKDGTSDKCLCEKESHYVSDMDTCKPRPTVSTSIRLFVEDIKTSQLFIFWTGGNDKNFTVILEWDPPSQVNISMFRTPWNNTFAHKTIENLRSGTNYRFNIHLEKENVETILLDSISIYTKPLPIQNITFYKYGENNTTVQWWNDPERPCSRYYVFINDTPVDTVERNESMSTYVIKNLTGGTFYKIKVISSVPGQNSTAFSGEFYTRPKPVTSVNVTKVSSHSFTMQVSKEDKKEDKKYHLYVHPNTSVENPIIRANENITINGLDPGTLYTVQIYSFVHDHESERFLTIKEYTRPLPPRNLTAINILENSLELQWAIPNSSFDQYILEYCTLDYTDNMTLTGNNSIQRYLIRNLTSGTGYSFRLYSAVNGKKSLEPVEYEVYTKPSGPSEPTLTRRMDTSISIQFPYDNNSYTSYQINGELYDRNHGYITIQNLTVGQYHMFTIFTVANYTKLSLNSTTFEEFTLPGPPSNIMFPGELLHETNLTVEWENVTEGNADGYFVQFTGDDSITEELNDTSFANFVEFTNLTAGVRYNVTIYSFWNGERSYRTLEGSTYTRPPAPDVGIIKVNETTLTLNITDELWEGYRIIVDPGVQNDTDQLEFMSEKLSYDVGDLMAGTKYTLEVFSIIGGIVGENGRQVSSYTKPDQVINDTIQADKDETTSSSLALRWEKPDSGLVDWYELDFMCTSPNKPERLMLNFTKKTNGTKATAWGLEPGTLCIVNITTHVSDQTGATSRKEVEWSTNESAPEKVKDIKTETEARSLKLMWRKPTKPNGIIRKYAVDVIDVMQNCSFSRTELKCTSCSEMSAPTCGEGGVSNPWTFAPCNESSLIYSQIFEDNDTLVYNVTDLHPYRNYTVVVTPFSRCYGQSSLLVNRTKQDAPSGAPISVQQNHSRTTADKLGISWTQPDEDVQNGIITHYTVYYKYKNKTCFGDKTGNDVIETFLVNASSGTNILTPNRYPFWPYEVTISAWTIVGEGPRTESLTMMTNESTPDAVRSPRTADNASESSIELHWDPPCFVNGIIMHYQIQVFNDSFEVVKNLTTTSNETQQIVNGLYPYHNYTMSVSAVNMGGQEGTAVNTSKVARTMTGAPYKPTDVKAEANSSVSIHVNWQTPELYTGITWYNVTAKDTQDSTKQHTVVSGSNFYLVEINIDGLEAFWDYTVTVTAITSAGHNVSETSSVVRTEEAAPGNVRSLKLDAEKNVTKPRSIKVTWTDPKPRDLNGILTAFYVTYTDVSHTDNVAVTQKIEVQHNSFIIHGIVPGSYNVWVFASTEAGNGSTVLENIPVPPGAPIKNNESANDPLLKESTTSSPSETQIPIQLPTDFLCDQRNGEPKTFGLIVAADTQATDKPFLGSKDDFNARLKTYKTWFDINGMEKPLPYITTATDWNPCKKRRKRSTDGQSESFTIGTQGDCAGVAPGARCNGKLKSGTSYRVKAFSCTDGGCAETIYSKVIKTEVGEPEEPVNLVIPIVGGVLAALVVSAVTIGTVLYLRRRQAACFAKSAEDGYTHRRSEPIQATELAERNSSSKVFSRPKYSPSPCLVRLSEFPDYVDKQKKDSGLLFSEAYKMIKENSPQHPTSIAESQVCRPKNRYTNILPFDYSRVKLLPLDDEEGTDYINANYIPGYTSRREYIATQGPMPSTFDDFWRMVWEQNVEIIVMLTKLVEKGRNKCDKYWPNQNEPQFYGDLSVSVMSESNLSDYTIRIMELKLTGEKRTVKQFSFLKWPDMGCPEYPDLLIEFVKSVQQHKSTRAEGRPMVIHCSAGVGRTGTFIAVDHLLQHIRDHDEIDIYNLVLEMRNNRCNMVQTEDQYIYIHECIREFISNDDQEDDYDDEDDHIYTNTQQENVYENTGFARPF